MSKERIIKTLKRFGLSDVDTLVYVFLAKKGPHELGDIALGLNQRESNIHKSLKALLKLNVVKASIEHPLEFIAVPFEEVINLIIEIKKEQAKILQASKKELLSTWGSMTEKGEEKS